MGADISRVRFDPLRDFAGVVLQQGRLLLDADFNELVALLDRRLRAETSDLTSFGPTRITPASRGCRARRRTRFRVTVSGGSSDDRPRPHVRRRPARREPWPADARRLRPAARPSATGTRDTPYAQQPYWPTPDPLPTDGTHLAYLDVWQREVTHLEDPDLVELAVGVDTTARWQTAWQVRLLERGRASRAPRTTRTSPAGRSVIAPSDGRLTTGTVEVDDADDPVRAAADRRLPRPREPDLPCRDPRGRRARRGRHRDLQVVARQRLGRDPGRGDGLADRAPARLASAATTCSASRRGDWVEILDDRYELDGELGVMRKVTVDDDERTITFTRRPASRPAARRRRRGRRAPPARAALGPGRRRRRRRRQRARQPRHEQLRSHHGARLRRRCRSCSSAGVAVSFSLAEAGGSFRRGDHWIFAARTADASVESLDEAPPLGVHHHYARLGVLDFPDTESSAAASGRRCRPRAARAATALSA